ncbi:carbohydrate sulfotransferase 1-like, partial [Ruditapes philippinarum]|uniref:carbohydrate sulfotransferase 1-like n=1 Tax=Ruditapes philippinarum TaxID=129788 RepID=UPI00295BDC13
RLQTIHLIRDPRGSLSSQIKIRNISWDRIGNLSEHFCHRVADDINSTIFLHNTYPDRAKILIYEKLAENPLILAEKLHDFTKMPRYQYVMRYIAKLTMGGHKSYRQFGSLRANSTKAAYGWRDTIMSDHVQTIDENCASVYDSIGYQKLVSEEHVRNHNLLTLEAPTSSLFF